MWSLAIHDRPRGFGVIVLAVLLFGHALTKQASPAEECRFEQTWYAGDLHFNERIDFRADATGTWLEGGMAGDAPHDRKEFTWERTASTLTVAYDRDQHRTVDFRIERRGACYLTFTDHPFLGDGSGFRHFADHP